MNLSRNTDSGHRPRL